MASKQAKQALFKHELSKKEIDDLEMSMSALRMEFRATLGF